MPTLIAAAAVLVAVFVCVLTVRCARRDRALIAALQAERELFQTDVARYQAAGNKADETISSLRQQLQDTQRQLHALTRYNGRRIEHEGSRGRIVRASVLGWYMDGPRPHLMIRPDPAPRRPAIPYGVPLAQCRFVDTEPTPPLPRRI